MTPPRSGLLSTYLALSERGAPAAERLLRQRVEAGKEDPDRLDERRGIASFPRPDGPLIWLHGASVGEALSLLQMIRRMGEERPDLSFLLTTGTVTSATLLAARMPPRTVHQYVPLDVHPWMARFLDHWTPDVAVLTESELWPALITTCWEKRVPLALINARITERSFRRWRAFGTNAARALLARISHVQAQDRASADRLEALGVPANKLEVTGTLKEGSAALPHDESELVRLTALTQGRPLWLAASTHEGEEVFAARAHSDALRSWQRLLLVLVPRHPERGPAIAAALRGAGWKVAQRSENEEILTETQVYLADTLGELGLWYRLCPVSFVGGSLVPVGGHNPFEPAALGSAILHGPYIDNFAEIYERLTVAGGAREIDDPGLGLALSEALEPDEAAQMAHAAWEVCSSGADVTEKVVDLLFSMLDGVD